MKHGITRLDSKGRVSIPFYLRKLLNLDNGDEFMVKVSSNEGINVIPLNNKRKIEITLRDSGQLKDVSEFLRKNRIDVLSSEIGTIRKRMVWSAILDYDGDIKKLKRDILFLNTNQ
ncbi:MAG: hypothetical protein V1900_03485 [Candidatus Aenigmatarchaeota archaeon]